jgi:LAO/AO transport system kinase
MSTDTGTLIEAALAGDRRSVARLISIVEEDRDGAAEVMAALFPLTGQAHVIGLTGSPGAGKSTLTDQIIRHIRGLDLEVGVIAVDPSSPFTGGAILGDRIRMQDHVIDPGVYIRSMGSRGHLGGMAAATPKAVAILDAVGKPYVLIETVGVGQAEVEIVDNTDTAVVVVNPGWGDSVQANKAGLLEIGDVFVVNKADREGVRETVRDLEQMLDLGATRDWRPPIVPTVATTGTGIEELWGAISAHQAHLQLDGRLDTARRARLERDLRRALVAEIARRAEMESAEGQLAAIREDVVGRKVDPWTAARRIADRIR